MHVTFAWLLNMLFSMWYIVSPYVCMNPSASLLFTGVAC